VSDEFGDLTGTAWEEGSEYTVVRVAGVQEISAYSLNSADVVGYCNPLSAEKAVRNPTLLCTGHESQRFYTFTRSEPE